MANELNLFCFIVKRSQVFNLHIDENDLSAVALVAAMTDNRFITFITEGIRAMLYDHDFLAS